MELFGYGLNDTASTILCAPSAIPIVSEVCTAIGWGAFKGYEAGQWVVGEVSSASASAYDKITDLIGYEFDF